MIYHIDSISIKDSNEDSFVLKRGYGKVIAAVSDGVGSNRYAKKASKTVIATVKRLLTFRSDLIQDEFIRLLKKKNLNNQDSGYATLTMVVLSPEENYAYVCGDGILYVNGELISSENGNVTEYFPNNHVIHYLPKTIESILIGTDGISKYVESKEEMKIILDYLLMQPLRNNEVINKIRQNPIDDVTIIKIVRKSK